MLRSKSYAPWLGIRGPVSADPKPPFPARSPPTPPWAAHPTLALSILPTIPRINNRLLITWQTAHNYIKINTIGALPSRSPQFRLTPRISFLCLLGLKNACPSFLQMSAALGRASCSFSQRMHAALPWCSVSTTWYILWKNQGLPKGIAHVSHLHSRA